MSGHELYSGSRSPEKSQTPNIKNGREPASTPSKENDMKLIEAKTAVILLKTSRLSTKNEYTQWLLRIMYQPCSGKEDDGKNVLYLSRNRRKIWATDFSINNQDPSRLDIVNKHKDQLYVITPKTTIMTMNQENRLVYIIDLSSSLATVGNTRSDILLSDVFQTLKNSLEGLVQPFSMQVSPTQKAVVQPSLRLTVMADCSQFASNVNIIPMLAEHPTMRVFMQNVVISANNIRSIIRKLKYEFLAFQQDTAQFRKFMKRNRANMGYNLDVGSEVVPPGVLDATSLPKQQQYPTDSTLQNINTTEGSTDQIAEKPPFLHVSDSDVDLYHKSKETSYHSSKKEVWGIGKSGANLSRILHAGHFALKLLPKQGRAQLILITDGAMKSNVHDNTFVRQFAEEDITCHIIQIGYANSFIPGRNFGFVPDTEILQFLARATCGTFMYSEKCLTKMDGDIFFLDQKDNDNNDDAKTPTGQQQQQQQQQQQPKVYPVVQFININKAKHISTPNTYHRQFLFRETVLSRHHHSEFLLQAEKDNGSPQLINRRDNIESNNESRDRFNFPWDPNAKPPEGDWRLLKYREYPLPAEFSHIIAARAREGFTVQSVTFDDGSGSKHVDSGIHDLEVPDFAAVRKERIQIVMIMRWQPNVSIEYRIRATWLPTVIGSSLSTYKSEDLLMSSGIFSRGKAPRAEIFVRTDAGFAHMLQNWDVFKRRAQMMGVVTGSIYFGETYAAPVYSKIEKLKSYLVDIYEADEVLKTVIGFPSKFWMNAQASTAASGGDSGSTSLASSLRPDSQNGCNTMASRFGHIPQKIQFIESFKDFWQRFNNSETRARTRCWYDPGCIDLLVGDVSPYMTPKLASTYNQDFVSNVEEDILVMIDNVKEVMREWADFEAKDGTFVRMMHKIMTSPAASSDEQIKDYFTSSLAYPPAFCELRVRHEYGRLITLRLLFFNVEVLVRRRAAEYLIHLLKTTDSTKAPSNMICQRPFSRLLMRDPKHFANAPLEPDIPGGSGENCQLTKNQSRSKAWYLPVAMWLTSEYIVRDYLRHMTWSWQTDNHQNMYHRENKMMPIHDLAFQFLCQARLDQGHQLVSPRPDSAQFYQEISLPSRDGKAVTLCAIQYFVWKDSVSGRITTELWMEPSGSFDFDQYEHVKRWTFEPDKKTISQLVTFDQIHAVGRSRGVGDFKDKRKGSYQSAEPPDDDTEIMILPQLFDVASVLRSNKFVVASFQPPQYKMIHLSQQPPPPQQPQIKLKAVSITTTPMHPEESSNNHQDHGSDQSGYSTPVIRNKGLTPKTHRYLRRHQTTSNNLAVDASIPSSPVPPIDSLKLFSYRPDLLLNKNKEVIAKLDVILQNYALLHYFVERSLDHLSSGEILMSHHDVGAAFWQDLKNALQSVTEDGKISSTGLIPDLRKTRCFIKIFDPRSFVVVLFPSLESVSSGLLKLQEENEAKSISTVEKCKFLDIFMFECVRQKPMRPTKNDMLFAAPLEEVDHSRVQDVIQESGGITIKRVEHLIHESDGLGVMLRPELFEGEYSTTCQNQAQLTDRILRVAQDVSRHYSQSFLKSFYTCLLRGFTVDDDDLSKVLEVCNESSMEIDITEFVNVMTMQKQESIKSDVQDADIQGKFNAIFRQYFGYLQTKNGTKSNLFYYKPPFTRDSNLNPRQENMSTDEKISYIVDLVAHSQAPLLIRLYTVYKTVALDESGNVSSDEIVIPTTSLPTCYSGQKMDGEEFNLEKEGFVGDSMFPLNRGETKVYLQIVCLNMTRSVLDDYIVNENIIPATSENLIQSMQSQPAHFSSFSQDQQIALAETDSRVNWLLKEETIHGLLKTPIISLSILKYVELNLSIPTNPYVDYQTCITLPLQFVKNNAESRSIFMNELEKDSCCQRGGKYQLKRVQDYFYVCEDSVFNMGDELSYSNSASPIVSDTSPIILPPTMDNFIDSRSHNEFCDGLGISISKFVEREEKAEESKVTEEASTHWDKRPLYWLILVPQEKFVQIYFYSKMQSLTAGPDIFNPIKEKIKVVQERTNRLSLLNYLQETRICSKYLEAPNNTEANKVYSDEDDEDSDSTSHEMSVALNGTQEVIKLLPSQFSCPIVYSKRYPLHWRLQPNVALNFLSTDVLRLFTVMNRPNMFVIERDGSIVYCKIYEETLDGEIEGSPGTVYGSPVHTLSGKNTEDDTQTLVAFTASETPSKRELTRVSSTSPHPRGTNNSRPATNEKRELVLEVYGIDLPAWIEEEFVNLIENRLISQITLNEIQQYFVRNSTSKPTAADVEFILPTKKAPTHREMLRVPGLVSRPYTLLQFFKQTLLADNIRQLTGPHVREMVETYYDNVFFTQDTEAVRDAVKREFKSYCETTQDIPPGAFCFYYNCTKRLPGASSALELLAGQGIAGICLTLLDERGFPITILKEEGKCGANFDPEAIRHCLEEEFREATSGTTYNHIWVDIWTIGAVDGDALMQHIYECYRRSLCDYFIEKTVTIDLGAALSLDGALQKAVAAKSAGRLGTVLRKKFIESILFILRKAAELKSPTVCSRDSAILTTPWSMDDLVRYLDVELRKIDPSLRPTVAWTSLGNYVWSGGDDIPNSNNKWELYRGFQYCERQKLQSNIRLVAISGLDEFVEKLGSVPDAFGQERRSSVVSDVDSQRGRSRRSSGESVRTDVSQKRSKAETQDQSRASSTLSNSGLLSRNGPQVDAKKHCFMIMTLDAHRFSMYTYNWSESVSQELFSGIFRIANRQESRGGIMTNILHQKMGLFHHTESMKTIVERFATCTQSTKSLSSNLMSTGTTFPSTPHMHHTSPKVNKKGGRQYESTNKLDATPTSRTPGSARRSTNNNLLSVNTTPLNASMLDLKDMIVFPTSAPSRESLETLKYGDVTPSLVTRNADQESHIDVILQNSSVKNAELDHALMDSITESVADTIRSKDFDILRRHGQPFLEVFLRRAKVQSAHRKALHVYLKWRKRYGDPEAEAESTERLSRPEVSTIMRSSRVLHFCRTPLIFCDPERNWSNLQEGSSVEALVINWFKDMGNTLMGEYAKYLEGADMQLLDFAKSNGASSEGESTLRATKFNLGKKLTAECPSTYLLRVFEGGSIICEIRLTSVFVSVTLYTLHRQYGRLDYNRFRRETRVKKRSNFKKFEENSGHFKQIIHISSFVYDFQLKYVQKMLENESKLPSEVDIMYFVRRFVEINQQPSPYAKDRILHGFYQFEVKNISHKAFFDNLFKNAPRHGLSNVPSNSSHSGASVTSTDLSFSIENNQANSNWRYTLIMCPATNDESRDKPASIEENFVATHKMVIEYFILVVYQGELSPESMTKTSWVKSDRKSSIARQLSQVSLPEEGITLADIVSGARSRLDGVVSEVIERSKRVHDWKALYSADLSLKKNVRTVPERPELIQLMSEFDRVDITEADSNLAAIFNMKLDWNSALNTVKAMTKNSSKDFHEGGRRHLLLYSARYMDFMIHLRIDSGKSIQGWLVSREKRTDKTKFEGAEKEQMASLAKIFYYYMWRVISDKNSI